MARVKGKVIKFQGNCSAINKKNYLYKVAYIFGSEGDLSYSKTPKIRKLWSELKNKHYRLKMNIVYNILSIGIH